MMRQEGLDQILDAFYAEGPTEAPDRVLLVVADRIGRQRQRAGWSIVGVHPPATRSSRLLVLLAAALLVALIGTTVASISGPRPTVVPTPTIAPALPAPPIDVSDPVSLDPGNYRVRTNYGATSFTVPAGWRIPTLGPLDYSLVPGGVATDDTVRVFFDMYIASKDAGCSETPQPGIDPTVRAMVADLVADPRLVTSAPVTIHIGGLDGQWIDVRMAPTNTSTCPFSDGKPTVPLLVDDTRRVPQQGRELSNGPFWGVGGTERLRVILLDRHLRTDGNVVFVIDSADGTTFDALVAAAMPVITTFTFDTGS